MWWYKSKRLLTLGALLTCSWVQAQSTAISPSQAYQQRLQQIERQAQLNPLTETSWIQANSEKYLVLQRKHQTRSSRGVVIVTHNIQQHPAWPGLVETSLELFPQYGWDVMSVAMPYIDPELLGDDAAAQQRQKRLFECLSQAFGQARQLQPNHIVLMLQGGYIDDVLSLFQQYQQQPDGLILISNPYLEQQKSLTQMATLRPALLDVIIEPIAQGSQAYQLQRSQQNQSKQLSYRQVTWSQHQLGPPYAEELAQYAAGWLVSLSKGRLQRQNWRGQTW